MTPDHKIPLETWLEQEYPTPDKPTPSCVRRWIKKGVIRGEKLGGRYFVYMNWRPKPPQEDTVVLDFVQRIASRAG